MQGMNWKGCSGVLNSKFPKVCKVFFNTIFVSSIMYLENPEGIQVIVGSMNMGYIFDTVRHETHNLIRHKREPIPLGHSDGLENDLVKSIVTVVIREIMQSIQSFLFHLNQIQILGKQNNRSKEPESYSNNQRKYRQGRHFIFSPQAALCLTTPLYVNMAKL